MPKDLYWNCTSIVARSRHPAGLDGLSTARDAFPDEASVLDTDDVLLVGLNGAGERRQLAGQRFACICLMEKAMRPYLEAVL